MTEQEHVKRLANMVPEKCDKECDYVHKTVMCKLTCFSANCPHTVLKENNHKITFDELLNKDWELK